MDSLGSEWSKWDLHVHTPCSLVHNYGGVDPWEDFLVDLEKLPSDFKAIGINDYLFLDGYRRVLAEKAKGRLQNIDLILPVIELRVPQFGNSRDLCGDILPELRLPGSLVGWNNSLRKLWV